MIIMYEMGKKINYEENVFYFPSCPKGDYIYMEACLIRKVADLEEDASLDEAVLLESSSHYVEASLG